MESTSRPLGRVSANPIGLGCFPFSGPYRNGARDDSESIRVIQRAVDLGINVFDTSDFYGPWHSEALLGRALRGRRQHVTIATKGGLVSVGMDARGAHPDGRPVHIRNACDASLRRLGVEVIDLYQLHRADPLVPLAETVGAMSELVAAGKVREIGVCELAVEDLMTANDVHRLASVQSELSLWSRNAIEDVLPWCATNGVAFLAYSPLGRGYFTDERLPEKFVPSDPRAAMPRFQAAAQASNRIYLDALHRVARNAQATVAQVSLAWVLAQGHHVIAIPGSDRIGFLEENAAAARLALDQAELAILDSLPAAVGTRY